MGIFRKAGIGKRDFFFYLLYVCECVHVYTCVYTDIHIGTYTCEYLHQLCLQAGLGAVILLIWTHLFEVSCAQCFPQAMAHNWAC